jgi:hypothetical protein
MATNLLLLKQIQQVLQKIECQAVSFGFHRLADASVWYALSRHLLV